MLNATYFTYNGIMSATYGLKIATFGGNEATQETEIFSPNISVSKSKDSKRFYITGNTIDEAPEKELSMVCDVIIDDIIKREVLTWLTSGNNFKKLEFELNNRENYSYFCKFKNIREITVNGHCVGFKLTAVFNSPYRYGANTVLTLANGTYNQYIARINNKSDIKDDYVYPEVTFTLTSGSSIQIINTTDDINRVFELTNLPIDTEIKIDNELKIISGNGVFLSNFNKKWLRLRKGNNSLKITINGNITIKCPQFVCMDI